VLVVEPKYRKPLNIKQTRLLTLIYKFRFVSVPLLSQYVGKDKSSVYENLYILVKQGYINKNYDKTYRLRGRPASYYLDPKGIKYLRTNTETAKLVSETALRNMYKNKKMTEEHIDHCLTTMAVAFAINSQTNNSFELFTRYELTDSDFFLRPLPDLYLTRKKQNKAKENESFDYTLDIFDATTPFWVLKKRLRAYQDHCDDAELEGGQAYPYVLLVPHSERREEVLLELIENMLQDFELYTTTKDRLLNSTSPKVWRDAFEQEEDEEPVFRGL
jgi:predicted transcriptional regulator